MELDAARKQLAAMLARIAHGDRAALLLLYRHTSAKLFGVCLRILRDNGEAEDVLQDVYMTVWRRTFVLPAGRGGRKREVDDERGRPGRKVRNEEFFQAEGDTAGR